MASSPEADAACTQNFATAEKVSANLCINSHGYGIRDVFNCSHEDETAFWYRYMLPYALFAPFRKDAVRVIRQLHREGHRIIPVTARAKSNENTFIGKLQRGLVKLRLRLKRIPYQTIVFCSYESGREEKDKVEACIAHELDIIIEDKKSNALAIQEQTNTRSFLFATRNNADIGCGQLRRFVNFSELYNGIRVYQEAESFNLLPRTEKMRLTADERERYYRAFRTYQKKYTYDADTVYRRGKRMQRLIRFGSWPFDKLFKHTIMGAANVPKEGGLIFTTNHRKLLDMPLVIRSAGRRVYHPVIKADFLETAAEGVLTDLGCIFVDRNDKSSREHARLTAVQRLLQGNDIVICPEGTRNKTDKPLLDFDFGAVSIAQNAGRPIVPCAIYHLRGRSIVNIGEPFEVGIHDDLADANLLLFRNTSKLLAECRYYCEASNLKREGVALR